MPETAEFAHYMPVRILRGARMGAPADPDLALINATFAADPLTADDVFAFDAIASSDAYDSYFTRMDPETTLPNYSADLAAGAALLEAHDDRKLPFGSSFRAVLEPVPDGTLEGAPATVQVRAGYYMLRNHIVNGVNTEEYRRGIMGGTHRKMSIGFYEQADAPIEYICDIDGKGLYASDFYPGQMLSDGRVVTYTIKNAHAAETSIVFQNGSPGALIQRVQQLVDQRHIPPQEVSRLEGAWHVRFARKPQQFFMQGDRIVDPKEMVDGILTRAGKKLSAATKEKLAGAVKSAEELIATIAGLLEEADAESSEEGRAVRTELGDAATRDGVRQLKAQARAGEAYISGLVAETAKARVAVAGDTFDAKRYETRLRTMDIEDLVDEHDAWAGKRAATFKPGRQVPVGAGAGEAGDKPHGEYLDYGDEE